MAAPDFRANSESGPKSFDPPLSHYVVHTLYRHSGHARASAFTLSIPIRRHAFTPRVYTV